MCSIVGEPAECWTAWSRRTSGAARTWTRSLNNFTPPRGDNIISFHLFRISESWQFMSFYRNIISKVFVATEDICVVGVMLLFRQQSWMKQGFRRWNSLKPRCVFNFFPHLIPPQKRSQHSHVSLRVQQKLKFLCLCSVGWTGRRQRGLGQKLGGGGELSSGDVSTLAEQYIILR